MLNCDFCGEPIPEGEEVMFVIHDAGPLADTVDEMIEDAVYKQVYKMPDEFGYTADKACATKTLSDPSKWSSGNPAATFVILKGEIE